MLSDPSQTNLSQFLRRIRAHQLFHQGNFQRPRTVDDYVREERLPEVEEQKTIFTELLKQRRPLKPDRRDQRVRVSISVTHVCRRKRQSNRSDARLWCRSSEHSMCPLGSTILEFEMFPSTKVRVRRYEPTSRPSSSERNNEQMCRTGLTRSGTSFSAWTSFHPTMTSAPITWKL